MRIAYLTLIALLHLITLLQANDEETCGEFSPSEPGVLISAIKGGKLEPFQCLLRHVGYGKVDVDSVNEHGVTPLMAAAVRGETRMVSALVEAGATIDTQDKQGYTALMVATSKDYHDITEILINTGRAGIDLQSKEDGYSALMIATINNNLNGPIKCPTTPCLLIKNGANLSLRSTGDLEGGKTAVHWAALKGRDSILRALLNVTSLELVNAIDSKGRSAVMCAAEKASVKALQELFKKGASVAPVDERGESALSIAVKNENEVLVAMIMNQGYKIGEGIVLFQALEWKLIPKAFLLYAKNSIEQIFGQFRPKKATTTSEL